MVALNHLEVKKNQVLSREHLFLSQIADPATINPARLGKMPATDHNGPLSTSVRPFGTPRFMDHPSHLLSFDPASLWLLVSYSAAILFASILGGWLPHWIRFTHTRMQITISLVGGIMLGVAVFQLLPHASMELGPASQTQVSWSLMLGMLVMFFLLRAFHFHQHGPADFGPETEGHSCEEHAHHVEPEVANGCSGGGEGDCELRGICRNREREALHTHSHAAHALDANRPTSHFRWLGMLIGLGFHTLLDGVAVGAAVLADLHASEDFQLWGFGVFLAVFLHKPLDAISITSLMQAESRSSTSQFLVNFGFALMAPLGILLVVLGMFGSSGEHSSWIGWGLGFSAGIFLCIALSDLLPEMEFHSHNRVKLSVALLVGIAIAMGTTWLEPPHSHSHGDPATPPIRTQK